MADIIRFAKQWLLPPQIKYCLQRLRHAAVRYTQRSREDRQLTADCRLLLGRHAGERCFILGAGPSIKQQNIRKLAGEFVISVSNTFVHADFLSIKPRYHVTPNILFGHGQVYPEDHFVKWLAEMETKTGAAEHFFHIGDRRMIESNGLFGGRTIHWVDYGPWDGRFDTSLDLSRVPYVGSVSELAITVALCMGFDKIYLLGFDHDWFNGPLTYFFDPKTEHAMKPDERRLSEVGVDAEFQMRRHAEIFKKYKYLYSIRRNIYNANADPAHYLDVFPKADFDALLPDRLET